MAEIHPQPEAGRRSPSGVGQGRMAAALGAFGCIEVWKRLCICRGYPSLHGLKGKEKDTTHILGGWLEEHALDWALNVIRIDRGGLKLMGMV